MSPRLVLATSNQGKVNDFLGLLRTHTGFDHDTLAQMVTDSASLGVPAVPETAPTFTGNAMIKAEAVAEHTGLPALADDSGLSVDVLGGAPGIFSARWAGRRASDQANRELLLEQLHDMSAEHRAARFVCVVALAVPGRESITAEGQLAGQVLRAEIGDGGFGYDSILQPVGETRSCAQLSPDEKNAISHRGQALNRIIPEVVKMLDTEWA